jgi:hypothetical protein
MSYFPMNQEQTAEFNRARRPDDFDVVVAVRAQITKTIPDLLPLFESAQEIVDAEGKAPFFQQYCVSRMLNVLLCHLTNRYAEVAGEDADTTKQRAMVNNPAHNPQTFCGGVVPAVLAKVQTVAMLAKIAEEDKAKAGEDTPST